VGDVANDDSADIAEEVTGDIVGDIAASPNKPAIDAASVNIAALLTNPATPTSAAASTNDGAELGGTRSVRLKIKGPKAPVSGQDESSGPAKRTYNQIPKLLSNHTDNCPVDTVPAAETSTEPPKPAILRRSTRKRDARSTFGADPAPAPPSKFAKPKAKVTKEKGE